MPIYSYKAVNTFGKVVRGELPAQSEVELDSKLKQSNLDLVSAKEKVTFGIFGLGYYVSKKEMALLCNHFYQLEKAGVPLLEAVAELRDIATSKTITQIMMDVYDSLKNGKSLSTALSAHPTIFDSVFIGLIKAGERTGSFAVVFKHLEHHYKWVIEIRKKIKKATTYPIVVLCVMIGVLALLMLFVMPKLSIFLVALNIPLPYYTIALIEVSNFFVAYWKWVFGVPIFTFLAVKIASKLSETVQYNYDAFKLKIPAIGSVLRKIDLARFCHFFAITYQGGLPILDCLDVSAAVVENLVIKDAILNAKADVMDGKKLTDALKQSQQFTPLVIRMFKVGEESGNLDQSIMHITSFYDDDVNDAISSLVEFLEPALTITMGSLLLWITMAVFAPIYSNLGGGGF